MDRIQRGRGFRILLALGILWAASACTRANPGTRLRLSIPTSSSQSSLSGTEKLMFVVINLRDSSVTDQSPKVYEFEMPSSQQVGVGQTLDLMIDKDIPATKTLYVQYLGVFETPSGMRRFSYGDVTVDASVTGDIAAQISATLFGSSAKEGRVQGRYYNTSSTGPNGTVVVSFQPPGTVPAMDIERTDMVEGWFSFFILDGTAGSATEARLTYRLQETGEVIFSSVNLGSFPTGNVGTHQIRLLKPVSYRVEDPASAPAVEPAEDYIIGFFEKSGASANIAAKKVCWPTATEAIPGVYADAALSSYRVYAPYSIVTDTLRLSSTLSGRASNLLDVYTNETPDCNVTTGNALKVYPHRLQERDGGSVGINGPFAVLDPRQRWGGFAKTQFDSGATAIEVKWRHLPSVTVGAAGSVNGISVWAKRRTNSGGDDGGGGGKDRTCAEDLTNRGFSKVGDVLSATGADQTYSYNAGGLVNSNNWHEWEMALCPFRDSAAGRRFLRSVAYANSGGSSEIYHYGWGDFDLAPTGPAFTTDFGGSYAHIASVNTTMSAHYSVVTTSTLTGSPPSAGNEVLLMVTSMSTSGGCGFTPQGQQIGPGHFEFARILAVDSGPVYKFAKGTFLDAFGALNTLTSNAEPGVVHCRVNMVRVPHLRNLTVGASGLSLPTSYDPNIWGAGGVIALRVNGTLTIEGTISASGKGYLGGASTDANGDGFHGRSNTTELTGSGGESNSLGAGGGGGWANGLVGYDNGIVAQGGQGFNSTSFGNLRLVMGGGGGYHFDGVARNGGNGGGVIFIAARRIVYNASGSIRADGVSVGGSGAGGGSVNILSSRLTASAGGGAQLPISAKGSANQGPVSTLGSGGGGSISVNYCQLGANTGAPAPDVSGGDANFPALNGSASIQTSGFDLCR